MNNLAILKSDLISQLITQDPLSETLLIFKNELSQLLENSQIGLLFNNSEFSACSISITPWQISSNQFAQALATAAALSALFQAVSNHPKFLLGSLDDFIDRSSLIFHLKNMLADKNKQLATGLNLSRQDLLLDKKGLWRLVESNSIAAGMGPFCEALREIQINYFENKMDNFPANPATAQISQHLYDAACKLGNNTTPLIVFVVVENEDNIFDQQKIAKALTNLGAKVVRKTFQELSIELSSNAQKRLLLDEQAVDGFYFRTGYNLEDYNNTEADPKDYLQLRCWIEQHRVVVAPLSNLQLATSKWMQMKLSTLSTEQLIQQFQLNQTQAKLVVNALSLKYVIPKNQREIESYLSTGEWILKTQNEGGGNVADTSSAKLTSGQADAQFMLMQKIDTEIRQNGLTALANNQFKLFEQAISELGILTLGEQDVYGGYLLRSKPANQLETGVHQAGGVLDSLKII